MRLVLRSYRHALLALSLHATFRLAAQPVAPAPERIADLRAMSEIIPRTAAASTPLTVNTASREEVRQFYRAIFAASDGIAMNWTGSYTTGAAGDTNAAFKDATLLRINFFRAMAGVPAGVVLNTTFSAKDQQAALMMSANNTLQHTGIPTTWTFYTAAGAEAAANSNLAIGDTGPDAVVAYMSDFGANNTAVGHRRWLLYPQTREMGTGDVPGTSTLNSANAVWVLDSQFGLTRPTTRTPQVPFPAAGYTPYQLVWPRWSFGYNGADFSAASVTMTRAGASVPVRLETISSGVGENALVWVYDGLDSNAGTAHSKPAADTTYTVNVNNVRVSGVAQNFSYNVTVFDPDVAGVDFTPVAVTGPATPTIGLGNIYSVAKQAFAGGFDWRSLQLAAFSKTYGAESGLDGITASIAADYSAVQTGVVGAGTASYHLAHSTRTNQILTLPESFFVNSASAKLTFLSRLGFATSGQVARVQVSTDDGQAWSDIYSQPGSGGSGESGFTTRSASLAAFGSRTIRVRLNYTIEASGSAFPQTSNGVGWYVDNLTLTDVLSATLGATASVGSGTTFSYAPAAAGSVGLQARGVLFGAYPLEWGPVALVTATSGGEITNPGRLINLSILTPLAAGETMTLGTVLGGAGTGGTKPLLVRAAGPSLTQLGVNGVLPDPTMKLINANTGATVASNNDWAGDPTLSNAFASVGAFAYASTGSKDAALFQNGATALPAGNYTVQVSDAGNGAGTVIAELYDSTPSNAFTAATPRLINVSVLKQIGAGETLTAGFVIGGATSKTVLVRAIGPTLGLAPFNIGGVMADPKLELFNNTTGAKINENNDWATPVAPLTTSAAQLTAIFTSVGAFQLANTATKDAVLLVTLAPGQYSARVSGTGGGGTAIVEIYEVP